VQRTRRKKLGDELRERSDDAPRRQMREARAEATKLVNQIFETCVQAAKNDADQNRREGYARVHPPMVILRLVSEESMLDRVVARLKTEKIRASWEKGFKDRTNLPEILFKLSW
jgi:hypothetical protein